jgi:hypothetical protein
MLLRLLNFRNAKNVLPLKTSAKAYVKRAFVMATAP